MSPVLVGALSFVVLLATLLSGIPIAVGMAAIGIIGFTLINGVEGMMGMMAVIPWSKATHYTFTVVPLFILMGNLIFIARFSEDLYNVARKWVGHLPGGLAVTTILACTGFAAACGSSTALRHRRWPCGSTATSLTCKRGRSSTPVGASAVSLKPRS